jgi:hypothetical protein
VIALQPGYDIATYGAGLMGEVSLYQSSAVNPLNG